MTDDPNAPKAVIDGASGIAPGEATARGSQDGHSGVDPRLLELLVCPLTKTRLIYRASTGELVSAAARLAFPIVDGVPMMIVDAARELGDDEHP